MCIYIYKFLLNTHTQISISHKPELFSNKRLRTIQKPTSRSWLDKLWHIHSIMKCFIVIKNEEDIMYGCGVCVCDLNKINKVQNTVYTMLFLFKEEK